MTGIPEPAGGLLVVTGLALAWRHQRVAGQFTWTRASASRKTSATRG